MKVCGLLSALACGLLLSALHAQAVEFVVTDSKLPTPIEMQSALYDGDDSIYLIGGYDGLRRDDVYKYSIATGTVTRVGTFDRISQGTAAIHGDDIFYFGGKVHIDGYTDAVSKYSLAQGTHTVVNTLPLPLRSMIAAHDVANGVVYNFGGINNNGFTYHALIQRYDLATNVLTTVGQLPEGRGAGAAVFVPEDGNAYIFGGSVPLNHESISDEILKFDPRTNSVTKLPARLPSPVYYSSAVVAANGSVYIAGQNELMRFDPATGQVETVDVEGWPSYWLGAGAAYVPKLNRIYFFGGYGRYGPRDVTQERADITYLDLSS